MKNLLLIEENIECFENYKRELDPFYNLVIKPTNQVSSTYLENIYPDLIIICAEKINNKYYEILKLLKKNFSEIPILLFDNNDLSNEILNALKIGAIGYFSINEKKLNINKIIQSSINGEAFLPKTLAEELTSPFDKTSELKKISNNFFTTKELIFLTLLKDAESYSYIAEKLNVSLERINFLIRNIYRKLHFYYNVSEVI